MISITLKRLMQVGDGGSFSGFSKSLSPRERVKPWCFVTFKKSRIFLENFIEIFPVVQKI